MQDRPSNLTLTSRQKKVFFLCFHNFFPPTICVLIFFIFFCFFCWQNYKRDPCFGIGTKTEILSFLNKRISKCLMQGVSWCSDPGSVQWPFIELWAVWIRCERLSQFEYRVGRKETCETAASQEFRFCFPFLLHILFRERYQVTKQTTPLDLSESQ